MAAITTTTQDTDTGCAGADTVCKFCGDDLKTYRALQIHLRTHNGCQRKPFECRRCGAAFLAKRNCIHHLLKQHPEVQEREIEEHIATLQPASGGAPARAAPPPPTQLNGLSQTPIQALQAVKVEELPSVAYPGAAELDQPLDFSAKGRGAVGQTASPGVKLEALDCSTLDQPIDLSIPSKRQRRDAAGDIKTEQSVTEHKDDKTPAVQPPLHPHPQLGCYQMPPGSTPPPTSLPNLGGAARAQRLKPLLPKPASSSPAALKELPPLASIAQIIHSVSGAPDLLRREAAANAAAAQPDPAAEGPGPSTGVDAQSEDASEGSSRKRSRKKTLMVKEKAVMSANVDLESSGEFASVEKMLATTDANKFSTYLQTGATDVAAKRDGDRGGAGEEKEGGVREDGKAPPSKGKKNAYSNSVQKMTCPFCPRVFPWASSLQRHMLTHTGQKPFPCPRCDAFFSTKSNCERHLLRKHGVTNRTLRRNGALGKKDGDEGSHESAESQSETEQVPPDAIDLSGVTDAGSTLTTERPAPTEQQEAGPTQPSPSHKPSPGVAEQADSDSSEQPEQQGAPANSPPPARQPEPSPGTKGDADDDDCHSNKSLDLNFGRKLIDFKLSTSSSGSAQEEPPSQPAASSSSSGPPVVMETPEEQKDKAPPTASPSSAAKPQPEYKHVCRVCNKSFRYATTLARHERAHLSEDTPPPVVAEDTPAPKEEAAAVTVENKTSKTPEDEKGEEQKEAETEAEDAKGGESEVGDSGESDEEDKDEEEGGASEPKSIEGGEASGGGRVDKRKKICNVCGKRFWSLQDLTRHMRSHTGERPYQCQTCERTFTLKHSLVRHQRIHLKPRGADGASAANDDASEDGDSCTPTPTSTCPPSENESECGSGAAGAKELEDDDVKDEEEAAAAATDRTAADPDRVTQTDPEQPSAAGDAESKPPSAANVTPQATDTKTAAGDGGDPAADASKDPSSSAGPAQDAAAAAPAEGFIQGLLEIHAKPPPEHILPNGEPPLVGVD